MTECQSESVKSLCYVDISRDSHSIFLVPWVQSMVKSLPHGQASRKVLSFFYAFYFLTKSLGDPFPHANIEASVELQQIISSLFDLIDQGQLVFQRDDTDSPSWSQEKYHMLKLALTGSAISHTNIPISDMLHVFFSIFPQNIIFREAICCPSVHGERPAGGPACSFSPYIFEIQLGSLNVPLETEISLEEVMGQGHIAEVDESTSCPICHEVTPHTIYTRFVNEPPRLFIISLPREEFSFLTWTIEHKPWRVRAPLVLDMASVQHLGASQTLLYGLIGEIGILSRSSQTFVQSLFFRTFPMQQTFENWEKYPWIEQQLSILSAKPFVRVGSDRYAKERLRKRTCSQLLFYRLIKAGIKSLRELCWIVIQAHEVLQRIP